MTSELNKRHDIDLIVKQHATEEDLGGDREVT